MAHVPPELTAFKERYPEFAIVPDSVVHAALNDAAAQVSTDIVERDYARAIMLLAAHMLIAEGHVARAVADAGPAKPPVKSRTVGDVKTDYAVEDSATKTAERMDALGSSYLARYREILRLNYGGPVVV